MSDVAQALCRAAGSLLHPRMWLLMIWPTALATLLWGVLAWLFGAWIVQEIQAWLASLSWYEHLIHAWAVTWFATALGYVFLAMAFVPLVLVTSSLIVGVFGMSIIIHHVAQRRYPELERKSHGAFAGSLWNTAIALAGAVLLGLVTLPLWLILGLWPFVPLLLVTYFTQRLFRYDALAEHATPEERRAIIDAETGKCWLLGLVIALIAHIPVLGFFVPVLAGLAFTYFGLEKLAALRAGVMYRRTMDGPGRDGLDPNTKNG